MLTAAAGNDDDDDDAMSCHVTDVTDNGLLQQTCGMCEALLCPFALRPGRAVIEFLCVCSSCCFIVTDTDVSCCQVICWFGFSDVVSIL